jgi:hypothetical protein
MIAWPGRLDEAASARTPRAMANAMRAVRYLVCSCCRRDSVISIARASCFGFPPGSSSLLLSAKDLRKNSECVCRQGIGLSTHGERSERQQPDCRFMVREIGTI